MSGTLKATLEGSARNRGISLAALLDEMATAWIASAPEHEDAEAAERQIRERAAPYLGSIHGGDRTRAQEASLRLRKKLKEHHARSRLG